MNIEYLKNKPMMQKVMWDIMEDIQDMYPHLFFGWYGFVPMVYGY